jgi:hypothetical protein
MTIKNKKMTSKTTKIILFSALMLTLLVSISGMSVVEAVNENASSNALTNRPEIPAAPDVFGCYYYTSGQVWVNIPCRTQEETKDIPIPTIGGTIYGVYGVRDSTSAIQNYGKSNVKFSTFSGETDSIFGTNSWSIQTNTNSWVNTGSSNVYSVQFTAQNDPTTSSNRNVCVWQNKISAPQVYTHVCAAIPLQTLSSSYEGYVEGKTLTNNNLSSQYCNVGSTTQCWLVVTSDTNQLHTHWVSNSGTILGLGSASAANFVSPASAVTKVTTGPATTYTTLTNTLTLETNNMSYGADSTSCAFGLCTRTSTSTK